MDIAFCIDNWNRANTCQKIPEILNGPLMDHRMLQEFSDEDFTEAITSSFSNPLSHLW